MRFGLRLFAGFVLLLGILLALVYDAATSQIGLAIAQSAEETMVDAANLLAEVVETDLAARPDGGIAAAFAAYDDRVPAARIFNVTKETAGFRVYITDAAGIVVFDSTGNSVGEDYSQWNDVYLTLRGDYGARTTRRDPGDEDSAILYVAAPLEKDGAIVGVLTVSKTKRSLTWYRDQIRGALARSAGFALAAMLVLAVALAWWFSRSVGRLRAYAEALTAGGRGDPAGQAPPAPDVSEPELALLAEAMAGMRRALDGKAYVEDYVRGLTHELKSPVAAIAGAVELLDDAMPAADRARFLANIRHETTRLEAITARMLDLAALEHAAPIEHPEPVDLREIAADEASYLAAQAEARSLTVAVEGAGTVQGDAFLIGQAVRNLLDNAFRVAPSGSEVRVTIGPDTLTVADSSAGVPDFALPRLTERFYALADPASGQKGTGLGLAFVRQIMLLHGGSVGFANVTSGSPGDVRAAGFEVTLRFRPLSTQ